MRLMLIGPAGAGKDTLAETLGLQKFPLADSLKNMTSQIFGVLREYFDDRDLKDRPLQQIDGLTPRQLLIRVSDRGFWDMTRLRTIYEQGQLIADKVAEIYRLESPSLNRGAVKVTQPDFWLDIVKKKLELSGDRPMAVTDVRHQNEFDGLKDRLISVAVVRKYPTGEGPKHSEDLTELIEQCDYLFYNNFSDLDAFKVGAKKFFEKLRINR